MNSGTPSDQPRTGWDDSDPNSGGSFVIIRHDDPDRAELEAQYAAHMRARFGDEAFERMQRSRALSQSPRPLTDGAKATLREALGPVLRDLAAAGLTLPDVREETHEERAEQSVCAWIQGPGGTGEGISFMLDHPPAEQMAELAEQFQNWAADQLHDAGRLPEWPECPEHPASPHRLYPDVQDGSAVWTCLQSKHVIWPIGEVAMPGGEGRRSTEGRRRP